MQFINIKLIYLALFFLITINSPIFGEENEYEEEVIVSSTECLQFSGLSRGVNRSYRLRFFNSCPSRVYAAVCVEERPEFFRVHESSSKIPKRGYLTIYSYEGMEPLSAHWASGIQRPDIPGPCGANPE